MSQKRKLSHDVDPSPPKKRSTVRESRSESITFLSSEYEEESDDELGLNEPFIYLQNKDGEPDQVKDECTDSDPLREPAQVKEEDLMDLDLLKEDPFLAKEEEVLCSEPDQVDAVDPLEDPLNDENLDVEDNLKESLKEEENADQDPLLMEQLMDEQTGITLYGPDGAAVHLNCEEAPIGRPEVNLSNTYEAVIPNHDDAYESSMKKPQSGGLQLDMSVKQNQKKRKKKKSKRSEREIEFFSPNKILNFSSTQSSKVAQHDKNTQIPQKTKKCSFCCIVQRMVKMKLWEWAHKWTKHERIQIVTTERPTECALKLDHISSAQLENFNWMTGCKSQGKVYCWPCTLFVKAPRGWWYTPYSKTSINMPASRHEATKEHKKATRLHEGIAAKMKAAAEDSNSDNEEGTEMASEYTNEDDIAAAFLEELLTEATNVDDIPYSKTTTNMAASNHEKIKEMVNCSNMEVFDMMGTKAKGDNLDNVQDEDMPSSTSAVNEKVITQEEHTRQETMTGSDEGLPHIMKAEGKTNLDHVKETDISTESNNNQDDILAASALEEVSPERESSLDAIRNETAFASTSIEGPRNTTTPKIKPPVKMVLALRTVGGFQMISPEMVKIISGSKKDLPHSSNQSTKKVIEQRQSMQREPTLRADDKNKQLYSIMAVTTAKNQIEPVLAKKLTENMSTLPQTAPEVKPVAKLKFQRLLKSTPFPATQILRKQPPTGTTQTILYPINSTPPASQLYRQTPVAFNKNVLPGDRAAKLQLTAPVQTLQPLTPLFQAKEKQLRKTASTQTDSSLLPWSSPPPEQVTNQNESQQLKLGASTSSRHDLAQEIISEKEVGDSGQATTLRGKDAAKTDESASADVTESGRVFDVIDELIGMCSSDHQQRRGDWEMIVRDHRTPQPHLQDDSSFKWQRNLEVLYKRFPWLALSTIRQELHCWPCLTTYGIPTSLQHLDKLSPAMIYSTFKICQKHGETKDHSIAYHEYVILKQTVSTIQPKDLDSLTSLRKADWQLVKHLINVVCTVKKNAKGSSIAEDCLELLQLISMTDKRVKASLERLRNIRSTEDILAQLNIYSDNIFDVVAHRMNERIAEEISRAEYVALMLLDANFVNQEGHIAVIVRYMDENKELCERFVKYVTVGHERTWVSALRVIQTLLTELGIGSKMVAYTYDEGIVTFKDHPTLSRKLRKYYPSAVFVHDKFFRLNKLFIQSLSHFQDYQTFFKNLQVLEELLRENEKNLGFELISSDPVTIIDNNYDDIINISQNLLTTPPSTWDNKAVKLVPFTKTFLTNWKTRFLVKILARVIAELNQLQLELAKFDANWNASADAAKTKLRDALSFEEMYEGVVMNNASVNDVKEWGERILEETVAAAVDLIERRTDMKKIQYCEDALTRNYLENKENGVENLVGAIPDHWSTTIDLKSALPQLRFIATHSIFSEKTLSEIPKTISDNKLSESLPDAVKVLNFILTTPIQWGNESRAYERILAYTCSHKGLDWAGSLIWLEKDLLTKMQKEEDFHDLTMDTYSKMVRQKTAT